VIALGAVFLLCLVFSAFFSGSEMAFVSLNRLKLRNQADAGDRAARKIMRLQDRPQQFLTSLLIGNNVVNIVATAIVTYWFHAYLMIENEWVVTAVAAPVLIIFGEMVPKDYCRMRSRSFLLQYSNALSFLSWLLWLPARIILKGVDLFLLPLESSHPKSIFVSEEEFRSLIEESTKSGVIMRHEKQLIDTILDFERKQIESVMIPLEKAPKLPLTATVEEVKKLARETGTRMILVYEEIPSLVVGMVYVFDVLFEEGEAHGLKNYLRSPVFLLRTTSVEKAFLTLQEKRQSFAVATDAAQEVIGVVPIERLLTL